MLTQQDFLVLCEAGTNYLKKQSLESLLKLFMERVPMSHKLEDDPINLGDPYKQLQDNCTPNIIVAKEIIARLQALVDNSTSIKEASKPTD